MQPFPCAVFTDRNLASRDILVGSGPQTRDGAWARRLRNTRESVILFAQMWLAESDFRADGTRRKRSDKQAAELARVAALCQNILDELVHDPTLEDSEVENLRERMMKWCQCRAR